MQTLAVLIPISLVLIAIAVAVFVWAVDHDQFDQLDRHAFDIFDGDDPGENS